MFNQSADVSITTYVQVEDQFGNVVTSDSSNVALSITGGAPGHS